MITLDAQNERVIMANDVWTIVGRGSTPRNHLVMVAIAKIIGKSLEELIVNVYDMPDLYRPDLHLPEKLNLSVKMCCELPESDLPMRQRSRNGCHSQVKLQADRCEEPPARATIPSLFDKLDEQDRNFMLDLMGNVEFEDFGEIYISLLTQVDMPLDGYIDLWVFYDNVNGKPMHLVYDWEDLAHYMSNYDYNPCPTIAGFVTESLSVLTKNLQIPAQPCSVTRYYDEEEQESDFLWDDAPATQNSYLVKIKLDIDKSDLMFLYEHSLERMKLRLAELEKEAALLEQENNKTEE